MSHRPKKLLAAIAVVIGLVLAYRKATADAGGTFDPDRPETH